MKRRKKVAATYGRKMRVRHMGVPVIVELVKDHGREAEVRIPGHPNTFVVSQKEIIRRTITKRGRASALATRHS